MMVLKEIIRLSGSRAVVLGLLMTLLSVNSLFAQTDTAGRELPFKKGEKLTYVLSYTWGGINTDVGEGVVTLNYDNGVYNPVVKGYTYRFYDMFFTVREHFESHFDEKTLRPLKFYRNTLEGKYRMINNYTFNNDTYEINAVTKKKDYPEKDSILPGRQNTYDLVTLYFVSRTLDFSKVRIDEKQPISFAIDREIFDLYFVYKGKEVKKMAYRISEECISCGACAAECPVAAITAGEERFVIDPEKCIDCGTCASCCPVSAPCEE